MSNQITELKGQHALVTGGARGIGAEITRFLLHAGANVTVLGRDPNFLEAMIKKHPKQCFAQVADITNECSVKEAFTAAKDHFGPIKILVNNAGQAGSAPFLKTDVSLMQSMLNVNLIGTMLCTQAALPDMLEESWGRIINIASTAGITGYAYVSAYCASKHAVVGLTRALALEVAKKRVTVNAICPGFTESDILRDGIANVMQKTGRSEEQTRADFAAHNPQGRIIQPSEIANTVLWLCSKESGSIHGQTIPICGGEILR
jgi:NAD(P)-dependent dehydrogenase (short-subunit alcohol dehydrogenase family)